MASQKELAADRAITTIHALADEETWQNRFRVFFEHPELFHSLGVRIEPGTTIFNLFFHDPQDLDSLIEEVVQIREEDHDLIPSVQDAEQLAKATIRALQLKP